MALRQRRWFKLLDQTQNDTFRNGISALANAALTGRGPSEQGIALTQEMLGLQRKIWSSNTIELSKALINSGKLLYCFRQYADSEKLLLEACDRAPRNRSTGLKLQRDASDYLVGLYEKWNKKEPGTGKAEKAAEWQQKVAEIDQPLKKSKPASAEPCPSGVGFQVTGGGVLRQSWGGEGAAYY